MDMRGHMDDNPLVAVFRGDQLERSDDDALGWDLRAGIGRNFDKLWLRSEGERRDGRLAHASTELFLSHATGPWWDRTIGLQLGRAPSELQSLMRISYAVFCLKKKNMNLYSVSSCYYSN